MGDWRLVTKDVVLTGLPRLVILSPNQGHKAARAKGHKGGNFLKQTVFHGDHHRGEFREVSLVLPFVLCPARNRSR